MGRINSIQVLRALAVTLVVASHAFPRFSIGASGVDLFFVVSGFIIATIAPGQTPGEFLFRRFWRIYPIYWLLSLPLLVTADIVPAKLAASLSLWPYWGGEIQKPYLVVAWTLYCEVLFYAAAALAMVQWRAPLVMFALAMLTYALTGFPLAGFLGTPMVLEFLAGVLLSRMPHRPGLAVLGLLGATGMLAVAPHDTLVNLEVLAGAGGFLRAFYWGIPAALIVYAGLAFDPIVSRLKWGVKLGDASYSVYLVFGPITAWLAAYSGALAFSVAIVSGIAVHYLVERPILHARPQWRDRALQ